MKKIIIALMACLIAVPGYCADEWLKTRPQSTDSKIDYPAAVKANNAALDRLLANYVGGGMRLTYSSGSTISVTAGQVVCSNDAGSVRKFRNNTSATNVTFSNLDTGPESSSKTYYIYAVADADATTATFMISASSSAPTGATYYKRLGSFYNDSSSDISLINNDQEYSEIGDVSSKNFGTTYEAPTDGIVTAYVDCSSTGTAVMTATTDSAAAPTTTVGKDACWWPDGIAYGSLSFPVNSGDSYKVTNSTTGTVSSAIYFTPLQ